MNLQIVEGSFSICRLNIESPNPVWALSGVFYSITKTSDELSIVCESKNIPNDIKAEIGWGLIKVQGPLDFGLSGILASLANPLAVEKISIFAISTFDTDYIMVKEANLQKAKSTLENSGFIFSK